MTEIYTNCHNHTVFSVKDGHTTVDDYVARVAELGHTAAAITDHGSMAGVPQFVRACAKRGIKPIVGCEVYMTPNHDLSIRDAEHRKAHHLTLLATNQQGYLNLTKIGSIAGTEGFYYNPRADRDTLAAHSEGIVCLSGCLAGELAAYLLTDREQDAHDLLGFYQEVYGERFFLELQNHGPLIPSQIVLNRALVELARKHGIKAVGTNDSHFCVFEHAPAHRALVNIKGGKDIKSSPYTYVRSNEEMERAFGRPLLKHTLAIAEMVETYELGDAYPKLPVSPMEIEGEAPVVTIEALVREGLQRRLNCSWVDVPLDYEARMETELDVIAEMGHKLGVPFERYLLTIADIARFCRAEGIRFGPRGSAAGSLVCWCLGISEPDPLEEGLLFERFLNPHRVELPDVDMDFQDDKRGLVLQYLVDTYGEDRVARITTYGAIGAKMALRDAARIEAGNIGKEYTVFGDELAKLIPPDTRPGGIPLDEVLADETSALNTAIATDPDAATVVATAKLLVGRFKSTGTHAAGVVVGDRPLSEVLPIVRVSKPEKEVIKQQTQYEMQELEPLGLLKFDILGLQTLSMMEDAVRAIERQTSQPLDLWKIDTTDPEVWRIFERGDTLGLFQLGSRGMTRAIMAVQPETIQELAMVIAIFRPGPLANLDTIAKRKHGMMEMGSIHPTLDGLLAETFGIPVYQEQIMKMMQIVAGFSLGEADVVRKAMGKKKRDLMATFQAQFATGGLARGYTQEELDAIWGFIVPFADYGFNRAHAVCYAYMAYQSAWLKAKYPAIFYASAMSIESRAGSKGGETSHERIGALTLEAKNLGITVLPPSLANPITDFGVVNRSTVQYGLGSIKNVGPKDVTALRNAVERGGPFASLVDLIERTPTLTKRPYEALIWSGAMPFGTRATMLGAIEGLIKIRSAQRAAKPHKNETPAEAAARIEAKHQAKYALASATMVALPEVSLSQRIEWELDHLGIVSSPIPTPPDVPRTAGIAAMPEYAGTNEEVTVTGVLTSIEPFVTRVGHKTMAYGRIADSEGSIKLVIWDRVWEKTKYMLKPGNFVCARGKIEIEHDAPNPDYDSVIGIPGTFGLHPLSLTKLLVNNIFAIDVDVKQIPVQQPLAPSARTIELPDQLTYSQAHDLVKTLAELAELHPGIEQLTVSYREQAEAFAVTSFGASLMITEFAELLPKEAVHATPVDEPVRGALHQRMAELNLRRGSLHAVP